MKLPTMKNPQNQNHPMMNRKVIQNQNLLTEEQGWDLERIEARNPERIEAIDTDRIEARNPERIEAIDTDRIEAQDPDRIEARNPERIEAIDTDTIEAIDTDRIEARNPGRIEAREVTTGNPNVPARGLLLNSNIGGEMQANLNQDTGKELNIKVGIGNKSNTLVKL